MNYAIANRIFNKYVKNPVYANCNENFDLTEIRDSNHSYDYAWEDLYSSTFNHVLSRYPDDTEECKENQDRGSSDESIQISDDSDSSLVKTSKQHMYESESSEERSVVVSSEYSSKSNLNNVVVYESDPSEVTTYYDIDTQVNIVQTHDPKKFPRLGRIIYSASDPMLFTSGIENSTKETHYIIVKMDSEETKRPLLGELSDPKVQMLIVDMDVSMAEEATILAKKALKQFSLEREVAKFLKEEFDKKYTKSWHCVVGRNYGSYVTNEKDRFLYIKIDRYAIMLYKSVA